MAVAISAILLVSLVSILTKSLEVSKRANTGMLSKGAAQAALDLMVTDLDSLVVSRNAGEVFRYTNSPIAGASDLTAATIYLLTTSMQDSYSTDNSRNPGVPRLVQYVISYTTNYASSSSNSFGLYRNIIDPTNTFQNGIGSSDLSNSWTLATNTTNASINLLVPNVVGMNVAIYTNYGAGIWTDPSSINATNTTISSTNFPPGLVLEISLTVLDEPALSRFGDGSGVGNNSPAKLINQFGRTLIRRVTLPSPP